MPTYGYECTGCNDHFEVIQSIKDNPLTQCGKCGGSLKKRIYPVGIAFKGSGFYVNDYAGKSSAATSVPDAPAKTEGAPAAPVKTEAVPAASD